MLNVPKKRVYVAAPWASAMMAREAMRLLRNLGHTITVDWTDAFIDQQGQGRGVNVEPEIGRPARIKAAIADFEGVRMADVVLVLSVEDKSQGCGMWLEMGGALLRGIPVVVCGPQRNRSVFHELADARLATMEEGVRYVDATSLRAMLSRRVYLPQNGYHADSTYAEMLE